MRSLGSIRARVERLASAWPPSPETVFVCLELADERCPSRTYDLKAHARAQVLAAAVARDPGGLPPPLVCYVPEHLTTCPRYGATLPSRRG
jgi:hypothetical protein